MSFKQEDADLLRNWSQFISEKARFDVSISEMIQAVRMMGRYQKITDEVEAHVVELLKVTMPEPDQNGPVRKPRKPKSD